MSTCLQAILDAPRIDEWNTQELLRRIEMDTGEVFLRAAKVVPDMMYNSYSRWFFDPHWDDLMQAAYDGVWHAISTWDPDKGTSLTTWAHKCAWQHVRKEELRESRWREYHELGQEPSEDVGEPTWDNPSDCDDGELSGAGDRAMRWQAEYGWLMNRLSPLQMQVLEARLLGKSVREIGRLCGISRTQVTRVVAEIQQLVAEKQQKKMGQN